MLVAWDQVSGNKGAATAGVDRRTASSITAGQGIEAFLDELRSRVRDRSFRPLPVRERMIPKTGGALRRLGIPTRDRSGGPGIVEVGVGADLRGGFPAVFLRFSVESAALMMRWPKCVTSQHVPGVTNWVVEGRHQGLFR